MNLIKENIDVASTDYPLKVLSLKETYDQLSIPSLGREIFQVYNQTGPLAGVFALDQTSGKIKLLRNDAQVFDSAPINTGISAEAAQDIQAYFGIEANQIIAHLLRGLANTQENDKTSEFLNANAQIKTPLNLSDASNARIVVEEISQRVSEAVIEMNSNGFITYQAAVVIPMKYAASFMARSREDISADKSFYVGKTGLIKYYTDPDTTNTDTVFVILKDEDRSGAFFSEYTDDIITAEDYDTGAENLFIFNRFAITANPKHTINPMMQQFALTNVVVNPGPGPGPNPNATVTDVVGSITEDDIGNILIKRSDTQVNPGLPVGFQATVVADGVDVVLSFTGETILETSLNTLTIPAGYAVSISKLKSNVWLAYEMRLDIRLG